MCFKSTEIHIMLRFCLLLAALLCFAAGAFSAEPVYQRRWVYCSFNNQVEKNSDELIALMDRAKAAGYNGIMLADYKFNVLDRVIPQYFKNIERVRKAAEEKGIEIIPAIFPIGYSNGLLAHDANLAEGIPVKDQPYIVKGKVAVLASDPIPFKNSGFEDAKGNKMVGYGFQDDIGQTTFADTTVFKNGKQSLRMMDVKEKNKNQLCRIMQQIPTRPWTVYRLSAWVKTENFEPASAFRLTAIGAGKGHSGLTHYEAHLKSTEDWKEIEVVFNSLEHAAVNIYAGQWGGRTGKLWVDDLKVEELSLVNLLRRPGCPFTITSEDGKTTYEEGKDFEPVVDSKLGQDPYAGHYKFQHSGATIRLKEGSAIKDGQKLLVSWYHPVNIHDGQMMCCLSEPKVYEIMKQQVIDVNKLLKPKTFFMSHDEIRCANWCKACTDRKMTPGQLVADNVKRSIEIIKEISPDAKIAVWNDVFDPHHNAVKGPYYLVNGSWEGSWEGLTKDVIIANWNGGKKSAESLKFFADRGHEQLIAGYYDVSDLSNFNEWDKARQGIPNVTGFMYTTWGANYKLMDTYGKAILEAKK